MASVVRSLPALRCLRQSVSRTRYQWTNHARPFSAAVAADVPPPPSLSQSPPTPTPTPTTKIPSNSEVETANRMRDVLRSVAQPVVVAVTRKDGDDAYHGATLTSFASLTLEPHPLVAFSLRLPSRMADLLRPGPLPYPASSPLPARSMATSPIRLTVSLLSGANQPIADSLAKPGLDQAAIFASRQWDKSDPPALVDAVGSLFCEVVYSVPLKDVGGETAEDCAPGSELFICRVVDANRGTGKDSLVHYQREYYSVSSHD